MNKVLIVSFNDARNEAQALRQVLELYGFLVLMADIKDFPNNLMKLKAFIY